MGAFVISPLPPFLIKTACAAGPLRSTGITPLLRCRVGGGALARWPPSAAQTVRAVFPHTAFTKTHASGMQSKGSVERGSQARTRRTAWFRQLLPATVPPTLESMRPNASHDPAVEPVEELSDVGSLVVMTPAPQYRIQFLNQLRGLERHASPGERTYLIHEVSDRFLPRDTHITLPVGHHCGSCPEASEAAFARA